MDLRRARGSLNGVLLGTSLASTTIGTGLVKFGGKAMSGVFAAAVGCRGGGTPPIDTMRSVGVIGGKLTRMIEAW